MAREHTSGHDAFHDVPCDSREPHVEPLKLRRQTVVVDPEQGQDRGVKIVHGHHVVHGPVAEISCCPVCRSEQGFGKPARAMDGLAGATVSLRSR